MAVAKNLRIDVFLSCVLGFILPNLLYLHSFSPLRLLLSKRTMPSFFKRPPHTTLNYSNDTVQLDTCHLIFRLPEIVEQIILQLIPDPLIGSCASYIPGSSSSSSRNNGHRSYSQMVQDILPLLYINWLWHDCVSRYTWRHIAFEDTTTEYEYFLKFANVISGGVSTSALTLNSAPALAVATTPDDASLASRPCDQQTTPMKRADSSVKPLFSILGPKKHQKLAKPTPPSTVKTLTKPKVEAPDSCSRHLGPSTYQNRVRSLTLRKVKERTINDPLQHIGYHVPHLTMLDIYICDYVTNSSLYPFLEHGQLTYLSLAGCQRINDEAILQVAATCPRLEHLDLRACGHVSDTSIASIAMHCPKLRHLNVGRVKDRQHITDRSIELVARHTQVSVLGLAGCDVTDASLILLATICQIERVSINNCTKITDHAVRAFAWRCPRLAVFEMKECHRISDWEAVAKLVKRRVLLTLCEKQSRACEDWAKRHGITLNVKAPVK